jgi:cobalt-zinc-cadmium resistance protein CzcA
LATVVIGGLLSATILTLFVLPVLYASFSKIKVKNNVSVIAIMLMLFTISANAQESLTWDATKSKVNTNNTYFKAIEEYKTEMKKVRAGGYEIPKTEFTYQQGQYNSSEKDRSYSLFQSFHFPSYYINNNELFKANRELNILNAEINKAQLRSELHYQFHLINTIKEKINFLEQLQSEIKQTEQNVIKQYELGLLSILDKSSVSFSLNKIIIELDLQNIELKQQLLYYNLLLGDKNNNYFPQYSIEIISSEKIIALEGVFEKRLKQIETINRLSWKTEQSKTYPDIKIGYTNQSLNGILDYGRPAISSDRFQFITAGISFPLFYGAQNAKNKMAKLEWEQSKYMQELENEKLRIKKSELFDLLKLKNTQCVNYQNTLIPELIQAMKAANKQLNAGNLKHIEWSQHISQLTDSYNMYYELKISYIQNITEYKLLNNEL